MSNESVLVNKTGVDAFSYGNFNVNSIIDRTVNNKRKLYIIT